MGKLFCQVIQSHFLSSIVSNPILLSCLIHCCIVRLDMINWKTNSFCSKSNFCFFFDWNSHWHRRLRCYPTKKCFPLLFSQIKNRFSTKIECAVKKLSMDWLFVKNKNQIELNWKPNGFLLILTAAQRWTPFTNPTQAQPKSDQSGG